MITLYLRPIDYSKTSIEEDLRKLPLFIQERIQKKKQKKKQVASLHGYLLLQQILLKENLSLKDIVFLESGKPILKNTPFYFNISHSATTVGLVVSNLGAVGLDIEPFRKFEKIETAFSFFSTVEQEAILAATDQNKKLIEFWSKKESLIKLLGSQMFDISAQTDVRFLSTYWLGKKYFFYQIKDFPKEAIYITASFSTENIVFE